MSLFRGDGVWPLKHDAEHRLFPDDLVLTQILELDAHNEKAKAKRWHADYEAQYAERLRDDLLLLRALQDTIDRLASKKATTERKYALHFARFRKFAAECVLEDGTHMDWLPAKPELAASFLLEELVAGKSYPAIRQISAAISDAHTSNDLPDPTQSLLVRGVVRLAGQYAGKFKTDDDQQHKEAKQ
jgi:hypothetical protein